MKTRVRKNDIMLLLMQLAVWGAVVLLPPLVVMIATRDGSSGITFLRMLWFNLQSPFLLYFVNFYILWPLLFAKKRYLLFVLANIIVFLALNTGLLYFRQYAARAGVEMPPNAWMGMFSGLFVYFLLNLASISAAIALRHFLRTRQIRKQLEEERHKSTEAELAWLKNQINPHFLFNTLNNISSLTQIDADAAQDAIAQLSDLLRYAIYKTNRPMVPINGEVEFMRNYISLMQLRCNEKTTVTTRFDIADPQLEIAPLLFVSLVENAFKHGVSSNRPSTIDIVLRQDSDGLFFRCANTNFPKSDTDRSGKGIGLANTRRRLELQYAGHYQWEQQLNDNIYTTTITIKP